MFHHLYISFAGRDLIIVPGHGQGYHIITNAGAIKPGGLYVYFHVSTIVKAAIINLLSSDAGRIICQ